MFLVNNFYKYFYNHIYRKVNKQHLITVEEWGGLFPLEYVIHTVFHWEDSNYVFKAELYIYLMSHSYITTVTEF